MFIFYGALIFIGLLFIGLGIFFNAKKGEGWAYLSIPGIVILLPTIIFLITTPQNAKFEAKAIVAENYELNLYHETVNNSHNEYVRYDFYERVKNHNKKYENYIKKSENPFYAPFYNTEDLEGCYPVPFALRNEDYFAKNTQG